VRSVRERFRADGRAAHVLSMNTIPPEETPPLQVRTSGFGLHLWIDSDCAAYLSWARKSIAITALLIMVDVGFGVTFIASAPRFDTPGAWSELDLGCPPEASVRGRAINRRKGRTFAPDEARTAFKSASLARSRDSGGRKTKRLPNSREPFLVLGDMQLLEGSNAINPVWAVCETHPAAPVLGTFQRARKISSASSGKILSMRSHRALRSSTVRCEVLGGGIRFWFQGGE
jgi:hypothetical protein